MGTLALFNSAAEELHEKEQIMGCLFSKPPAEGEAGAKPEEKVAETSPEKLADNAEDKSGEKPVDSTPEKETAEPAPEKVTDKAPEKEAEKGAEKAPETTATPVAAAPAATPVAAGAAATGV